MKEKGINWEKMNSGIDKCVKKADTEYMKWLRNEISENIRNHVIATVDHESYLMGLAKIMSVDNEFGRRHELAVELIAGLIEELGIGWKDVADAFREVMG